MMTNISWDDWERRQESWRRETDKTEAWREGGIDRFCLEGLERKDLDGGKETVVAKRYEEEREQTEGKESERLQEGCAALGCGLSYPLNTSVCAAARRTWCTRVDVGVCTCTLRYREVAAATAMEWVSVWEQEEAGRIWFLSPSSRRAGSFCARAKWSNVLFIPNVSAPRFDLTTRCKNAVSLCVGVTDQLWVLCGCLWTRLHRMATSQEHKWNCWVFEPD